MDKLCIFAGTTEGRALVQLLQGQPLEITACVATEYGETLLPEAENLTVRAGRMTREEMKTFLQQEGFRLVVDATHPYAAAVTENIAWACAESGTAGLRLLREAGALSEGCVYAESLEQALDYLDGTQGRILLTTGSKELSACARLREFDERCYARVLPMENSLQLCEAAGLKPSHIIAMQGPFSVELNRALLHAVDAAYLLTKRSGAAGGFQEKLEACRETGTTAVVIGRPPQREGVSFPQAVEKIRGLFSLRLRPRVTVAGIGPGSPETMTAEVCKAIAGADCLIGAKRMLEAAGVQKPSFTATKPELIAGFIRENPQYSRFTVLMSGDTGFYSGTKKLLPLLQDCDAHVLPGISSLACLSARAGLSWEDIVPVSLHGREGSILPALQTHRKIFVLVGGDNGLGRLCGELTEAGMGDTRVIAGENLSYETETITCGTARELGQRHFESLCAAILLWDGPGGILTAGLPDEAFLRTEAVPMTKSEIRAVCLSKLQLTKDSLCWDVGAGTGSVSIEMARLGCRVYAVEKKAAALEILEENRKRFGCNGLTVVPGTAPEALEALPAPTHVFIGGSSGNLPEILEAILRKNPKARIVASAIALETVGELTACLKRFPFACTEVVSLTAARDRKAGPYHLMTGLNPVYLFTMQGGDRI